MLIDLISQEKGIFNIRLKHLSIFLENFPFDIKESLMLSKRFDVKNRALFDEIFNPIHNDYKQNIEAYGFEKFIGHFKEKYPNQFFMLNRIQDINLDELVTRAVFADLKNYLYTCDDFVLLPEKENKVANSLGLSLDKYGLVTADERFIFQRQGIVFEDDHLLFYHPFLRRYFTSNFTEITKQIVDLSGKKDIRLQFALDPLRMNSVESLLGELMEFDHWRGPKFDLSKLNDRNFIGKVVYKRISITDHFSWPVDRIEVNIKNQSDNEKSITIQEINPSNEVLGGDDRYAFSKRFLDYSQKYQFSKFAHFIWNKTAGSFSHLDIAVIVYDKKDFNIRFRSEFPEKSVVSGVDKVKLVRADGDIPLSTVQGLIGDFFRYNELVQEFFEGK